jgi:hypothetical protein
MISQSLFYRSQFSRNPRSFQFLREEVEFPGREVCGNVIVARIRNAELFMFEIQIYTVNGSSRSTIGRMSTFSSKSDPDDNDAG